MYQCSRAYDWWVPFHWWESASEDGIDKNDLVWLRAFQIDQIHTGTPLNPLIMSNVALIITVPPNRLHNPIIQKQIKFCVPCDGIARFCADKFSVLLTSSLSRSPITVSHFTPCDKLLFEFSIWHWQRNSYTSRKQNLEQRNTKKPVCSKLNSSCYFFQLFSIKLL